MAIEIHFECNNRYLYGCKTLDELKDKDQWSFMSSFESGATNVEITGTNSNESLTISGDWIDSDGNLLEIIDINDPILSLDENIEFEEIKDYNYIIIEEEHYGGSGFDENDVDCLFIADGHSSITWKDCESFRYRYTNIGLIEHLENDRGDTMSVGTYDGNLHNPNEDGVVEEVTYYAYKIRNKDLVLLDLSANCRDWEGNIEDYDGKDPIYEK